MLGQPLLPADAGRGRRRSSAARCPPASTATDLVLTLTEMLRKHGVVGKFVEFCGDGLSSRCRCRPRDALQHVAGVRRDRGHLPGRRRDAALPAPDRPRGDACRAGRALLPGSRACSAPTATPDPDLHRAARARPRRRRAEPRRPAPPAGPRGAGRRVGRASASAFPRRAEHRERAGRQRRGRRLDPGGDATASTARCSTAERSRSTTAPSSSPRSRPAPTPRTRR